MAGDEDELNADDQFDLEELNFSAQAEFEMFEAYTSDEKEQAKAEIEAYFESEQKLLEHNFFLSVGYDAYGLENFLMFPSQLKSLEASKQNELREELKKVLEFNTRRTRRWQIVYFYGDDDDDDFETFYEKEKLYETKSFNDQKSYF